MLFRPTEYLEAVKEMDFSGIECNLAFSGVECPFTLAELGVTARILHGGPFHAYGDEGLKEKLAALYGVRTGQVLVPGGGTSLCNYLLAAAILKPGDRVLVETPTYEPLRSVIVSTGAEVIPLHRPFENGFDLDVDEVIRSLQAEVKLIVITRLHNPSGRDVPAADLLKIAEKAEESVAYVLVDEVYLDFLAEDRRQPAASLHPRLLSTNGLTKVYGLGDMRIGWAVGPQEIIWKAWRINNLLGVNPPSIPDRIALELFDNGGIDRIAAWSRRRARENLGILVEWMGAQNGMEWVEPDGGVIAYVDLKDAERSRAFLEVLRSRFRTAVMPGKYFDLPAGFRLGFGAAARQVKEGLRRIGLALSEID